MLDRIRTLLTARQLSPTQFADTIGVSRPIVSHILSGRNKPSLEVVQKIVGAFPDLSLRWLLNGEGPMLAARSPAESDSAPSRGRSTVTEGQRPAEAPQESLAGPHTPQIVPVTPVGFTEATAEVLPVRPEAAVVPPPPPGPLEMPAPAPVAISAEKKSVLLADGQEVSVPVAQFAMPLPPAGADIARSLATPGKGIRRIVIFYQDGTFADYQPEAAS
ncbi:helix-turn-helix domain-containing protein [Hymenobacter perfusus]|uniref:XRE family transcriptional regulator n=1 Tax=Hymenobacter perfusus TaxID=1236770 RepID=A0A428KDY0_9BACT|nr:XRE family transcriptional regulator [Hymenobacter perfusus]